MGLLSCTCGPIVIYQRYVMVFMMHLAILNAYHLRVVLNIAMPEMLELPKKNITSNACPEFKHKPVENLKGDRFQWDNNIEAVILYAFYIGYLLSHIPGGWIADKVGARHVIGLCMLISTFVTALYPFSIQYGGQWVAVGLRVLLGIVQGPLYPAISTLMQCWVPKSERAFLGGIAYGGSNLGTITGNILTGIIIKETKSWEYPFYVWAGVAFIWYLLYLLWVFSEPQYHPFITPEEVEYLSKEIQPRKKYKVPWKKIFACAPFYALLAGQFGHDYLIFSLVTDLPKYLHNILKYDIRSNAIFTAVPFALIWISSILTAFLADWIVNKGHLSVLTTRRIWTAVSAVGSGAILLVTVYVGCNRELIVGLYTLALFVHGPFYSGMKVNVNDITVYYGGVIMAIVNGFGAIGGIVGPLIIGFLTAEHTISGWQIVYWIMLVIMIVTTILYWIFTSAERQDWDYPED